MSPAFWLPPVAWMVVIGGLSSGDFSADQTSTFLVPILRWIAPWATGPQLELAHAAIRKLAHMTEYAILALLWQRAFVRGRALPPRVAARWALLICVGWAVLDEVGQSLGATRTGSAIDVGIDVAGAVIGLAIALVGWRLADRVTVTFLWVAAAGGAALLALNAYLDVASGALWITVPAAAAALVLLHRRRA
jgi:VanZ family protein